MKVRVSHLASVFVAALLALSVRGVEAASAFEPTVPGYLEEALANPPGMPPPPASAPPSTGTSEMPKVESGPPTVKKASVVRYEYLAGRTVRVQVAGGYCLGETAPSIERVRVREYRLPGRTGLAVLITAFLRHPAPLVFSEEGPPPGGEGADEPVPVCEGIEQPLFERITLRHRAERLTFLDGSTSPPRRIPSVR